MPTSYFRSDVYYVEQDLSQAIAGVSTSIGAIVGASKRGPIYRRLMTDSDQYTQKYGQPDASVSFMGYCSLAFLEEANQLWVRRVVGANAMWGGVVLQQLQPIAPSTTLGTLGLIPTSTIDPDVNGFDWATLGGATNIQDNILSFYAEGPGSYSSDLSVEIQSDNLLKPTGVQANDMSTVGVIVAGLDASGDLPAGTYQYGISAVNRVGETLATLSPTVTLPGGVAAYLQWNAVVGAIGYSIYRKVIVGSTVTYQYLQTVGASSLAYADYGLITPDPTKNPVTTVASTPVFTVLVYDNSVSKSNAVETFSCTLSDYTDGMGSQLEVTQQINGVSNYIRVLSNSGSFLTDPAIFSVARTTFGVGDSGAAVQASDIINGWQDFADEEDVEVRILINGGYAIPSVQLAMDTICQNRQDCISILDVPSNKQSADLAIDYRNIDLNLNSNRSTLYAQDVFIQDSYSNKRLFVPPSGHIAGVYAYTDNTTYPWFAPAGMNRGQLRVLATRYKYNKGERDNLWKAQINYIRTFNGLGRVVWEQRTLQVMQSGFSFVNVRRMMDTVSIAVRRALIFDLFEPNDDFLRLQLKTMIEDYLRIIQQARGIKKFLVVIDDRNNPPYFADQGQLNIDMLITPIIPAEKIRLRGTLTKQGADFGELIAAGALS